MKRIISSIAIALLLAACTGNTNKQDNTNNSNTQTDTVPVEVQQDSIVLTQPADTVAPMGYDFDTDKARAVWKALGDDENLKKWAAFNMDDPSRPIWILSDEYGMYKAILNNDYEVLASNMGGPMEILVQSKDSVNFIVENIAQGMFAQSTYKHIVNQKVADYWVVNQISEDVTYFSKEGVDGQKSSLQELAKAYTEDADFQINYEKLDWTNF